MRLPHFKSFRGIRKSQEMSRMSVMLLTYPLTSLQKPILRKASLTSQEAGFSDSQFPQVKLVVQQVDLR